MRATWALVLAVGLVACDFSPYRLGGGSGDEDAGVMDIDGGGGVPDADTTLPDARDPDMPDACLPMPERTSILQACDGVDNDCDGDVDEDYDLDNDPANCGSCGKTCSLPGANGTCVAGECQFECRSQFHDLNMDLGNMGSNGCEYGPCDGEATDPETCNGRDDDCDNMVDENVAGLESDPDNCGECFKKCIAVNVVTTQCNTDVCGYDACLDDKDGVGGGPDGIPDYADVNSAILGCEYACPVNPPLAQEECNGVDDDCDGIIDELPITGLGDACGPTPPGDTGECSFGQTECIFGVATCVGYQGPRGEVCDGLDNDCNGVDDDGFDKDSDPNNCGPTCEVCDFTNAVERCNAGVCEIERCLPGFADDINIPGEDCLYACTATGPEDCDGIDNDCNGLIDDALPTAPPICNTQSECAGTTAFCGKDPCDAGSATTWRCRYDGAANTETDACGNLVLQEVVCDSLDGDCDGVADESFPLGDACDDGGTGICRGTGTLICDSGDPSTTACNITSPGQTALTDELCNALDDDCDGTVDEDAIDDMIGIDTGGDANPEYFIDTYEASRPDASFSDDGANETRACSNPDVLPWRTITWEDAELACQAAGKRLCTKDEWQRGCQGSAGNEFPYGATYDPLACNGYDYDVTYSTLTMAGQCNGVQNDEESSLPTGFEYACLPAPDTCTSDDGLYDMSGNVQEWTGTAVDGAQNRQVMGGSYASGESALACTDDFLVFDNTVAIPTLGFRCCMDAPAP